MKNIKKIIAVAVAFSTLGLASCADLLDFDLSMGNTMDNGIENVFGSDGGPEQASSEEISQALKNVDFLFVNDAPRPPKYDREAQFGKAWTDANNAEFGGNGCDTRNDILKRDLVDVTFSDSKECTVATGVLENDPYTGRTIDFRRGSQTSRLVQIEHIVALKNAWDSGAWKWTQQERIDYANDPSLLIAVDGPENGAKGDKSADKWLVPNNPAYQCTYAAKQVEIKNSYGLSVTSAEQSALRNVLSQCGQ